MANNRLWLVHKPTGKRVMLAKYYPTTGWYTLPETLDRVDFGLCDFDQALERLVSLEGTDGSFSGHPESFCLEED